MAIIRDPSNPARILKINEDGSINVVAVLTELEVKNDAGNPLNVTDPAFGTAGGTTAPPNGTGVIGWLRGIYDKLVAGIAVTGTQTDALTNAQLRGAAVPISGTMTANQGTAGAQAWPVSGPATNAELRASALPVSVGSFPANQGVNIASGPGSAVSTPLFMARVPDNLAVTAVGAAAAAVTATLPAVAGEFHYIDAIEITCYASAAGTGGATPVTVASTNLPGSLAWSFPSGRAIGTNFVYMLSSNNPLRSATAGVATTIVCPATTGVIWRVNVIYRTSP